MVRFLKDEFPESWVPQESLLPENVAPPRLPRQHGTTPTWADITENLDLALLPPLDRPGIEQATLTPEQLEWRRTGVVTLKKFLPVDLTDAHVAVCTAGAGPTGWHIPSCYLHLPEIRALRFTCR